MKEHWYETLSYVIGGFGAVIAFFASWIYFGVSYGLLGVALGWFPAMFLGLIAYGLTALFWPAAAAGVILIGLSVIR